MSSAEDVYQEFCKRTDTTNYDDLKAAFSEFLADDAVWANTGFPTAEGKEACLGLLDMFHNALNLVGVRIDNIAMASKGDVVVTERVDHLITPDGIAASLELAGTFEISNGKIKTWRDYFDPRPFLPKE